MKIDLILLPREPKSLKLLYSYNHYKIDVAIQLSPSSSTDDATSTSGSSSSIGYMEHTVSKLDMIAHTISKLDTIAHTISKLDTIAGVAIKYVVEVTNSFSCFFQSQISTL